MQRSSNLWRMVCVRRSPHTVAVARASAFTLVELLVVIAIITILTGFVVSAAQGARRRAAVTKTTTTIASLEAAIEMYESDTGQWPSTGNAALVEALRGPSSAPGWQGPYMRFKQGDLGDGQLLDAWGNPYVYTVPGDAEHEHEQYFDIVSYGSDGEADTSDDITNW